MEKKIFVVFARRCWIKTQTCLLYKKKDFIFKFPKKVISLHPSPSTWQLQNHKIISDIVIFPFRLKLRFKNLLIDNSELLHGFSALPTFQLDFPPTERPIRSRVRCCNRLLALNADTAVDKNSELVQSMAEHKKENLCSWAASLQWENVVFYSERLARFLFMFLSFLKTVSDGARRRLIERWWPIACLQTHSRRNRRFILGFWVK